MSDHMNSFSMPSPDPGLCMHSYSIFSCTGTSVRGYQEEGHGDTLEKLSVQREGQVPHWSKVNPNNKPCLSLLSVGHCFKCFAYINSVNSHLLPLTPF